MIYRLFIYLIMANLAYLIFSLFQKGFKHYSGYIFELLCLLCFIIGVMAKGIPDYVSLLIASVGFLVLVLLPIYLQRRIDMLMAENRLGDIEFFARIKSTLALTDVNTHLHNISLAAAEYADNAQLLTEQIRSFLGKGEPFDSLTRVFLGLLNFNSRNFSQLITDLRIEGKDLSAQSFEELLCLVRAYLETARYSEAVQAQETLEKLVLNDTVISEEKTANMLISRMLMFAFMGWQNEFLAMLNANLPVINSLPPFLTNFWLGVCLYNSGHFAKGEEHARDAINACAKEEFCDETQLLYMQKRLYSMQDNRDFFEKHVSKHLAELYTAHSEVFKKANEALIKKSTIAPKAPLSKLLTVLISSVSLVLITLFNVNDTVDLIKIGANSSFLVRDYGEYFRLFTYNFVHIGFLHLLMNMAALYCFAGSVEAILGPRLFLFVFCFSGITGGYAAVCAGQALSAGASAAVLGLLAALIVLQLFKADKNSPYAGQNNFGTLVFILVLNLAIGAVEKGIDNSAHLGGLIGGFVSALALVPVLKHKFLKKLAGTLALCAVAAVVTLSAMQISYIANQGGFYPQGCCGFINTPSLTAPIVLDVPLGWNLCPSKDGNISIEGPFNEKAFFAVSYAEGNSQKILSDYIEGTTEEIMSSTAFKLKSRTGPQKLKLLKKSEAYRIGWLLTRDKNEMTIVDYVLISNKGALNKNAALVIMAKFFLGTQHSESYNPLMERVVSSIRFNFFGRK